MRRMTRMKRHKPEHRTTSKRRRSRRNPEARAAVFGPVQPKKRRSASERIEAMEKKLSSAKSKAAATIAKLEEKAAKATARAAKRGAKVAKAATRKSRSKASTARNQYLKKAREAKKAGTATQSQLTYLAAHPPKRAKRKPNQRTRNQNIAKSYGSGNKNASKPQRAIVKAWRSAKIAQKLAVKPQDRRLLSAMGLAGVPNPGMGGMFKDISALLPQMGVSAISLAVAAVASQMIASKIVPADKQSTMLGKIAPSALSLGIGLAGYMALRKSKSMGKFAPWVLAGGVAAAAVHAIARITITKDGQPISLGKHLGLPIGEYASMAGISEYASMAGGTSYSGSRGVFSGLDDTDPVLSGTDDEDEVDMLETNADEGVNSDEGSLNGSIFD